MLAEGNVGTRSVQSATAVLGSGKAELLGQVEAGELAVSKAAAMAKPKAVPEDVVDVPPVAGTEVEATGTAQGLENADEVTPGEKPLVVMTSRERKSASSDGSTAITQIDLRTSTVNSTTQSLVLTWPGLNELIERACNLVETKSEAYRSKLKVFDPKTEVMAWNDDPRYCWTTEDHDEEIARAFAYSVALKHIGRNLADVLKQVRANTRAAERYVDRLTEDRTAPLMCVVKKQPAEKTAQSLTVEELGNSEDDHTATSDEQNAAVEMNGA